MHPQKAPLLQKKPRINSQLSLLYQADDAGRHNNLQEAGWGWHQQTISGYCAAPVSSTFFDQQRMSQRQSPQVDM
jgi:hypothetical protein